MSELFTKIYQDAINRNDDDLKTFLDDYHKKDDRIQRLNEVIGMYEKKIKENSIVIITMYNHPEKIKQIFKDWVIFGKIEESDYDDEE